MKRILLLAGLCAVIFASCTKTVVKDPELEVLATSFALDKAELAVPVNEEATLHAIIVPEDAGPIAWISNAPAIASVSKEGVVKGNSLGEAEIFAAAGNFVTSCHVTVVNPITEIVLNKASVKIAKTGTFQLTATIAPDDATEVIVWSSDKPEIASVDENGLITAVALGNATITAKAFHTEATCEVEVTPLLANEIIIEPNEMTGLDIGSPVQFTATVYPEDADDKSFVWSVEDENIATIDENGVLTALAGGATYVRATASNGVYGKAYISVAWPVPFYEDFDDINTLGEWIIYDYDEDGYNWYYGTSDEVSTHSGTGCLYSHSWYSSALTPDNWVITPRIALDKNYNRLSFWVCPSSTNWPEETYGAYILVPDEEGEITLSDAFGLVKGTLTQGYDIIYEETPSHHEPLTDGNWENIQVDIPETFNGKKVFFAIRHFDCTDMYSLILDDIEITNVAEEPEPDPDPTPDPEPAAPRLLKGNRSTLPGFTPRPFGRTYVK